MIDDVEELPDIVKLIVKEIKALRQISNREEYYERLKRVRELWMSYEQELPIYTRKEIKEIIRRRVGKVDLDKCVRVSEVFGKSKRPLRFTEILEEVRDKNGFKHLGETSFNKTLARILSYLANAGLVVKCCRVTIKGKEADVYYFRLFRFIEVYETRCKGCVVLRKIQEIIKEKLHSHNT